MTTLTTTRMAFSKADVLSKWNHAFSVYLMAKGYSSTPINVQVDKDCVVTLWAEENLTDEQKADLMKQMTSLLNVRTVKPGFGPSEAFEFDYAEDAAQ